MKLHRHRLDACSQKMHFNRDANLKPWTTTKTLQKSPRLEGQRLAWSPNREMATVTTSLCAGSFQESISSTNKNLLLHLT